MKVALELSIRRVFCFLFVSMVALFLVGCKEGKNRASSSTWMQNNGKLKILCTTAMCQDLVASVSGDVADCHTLIQGESDPHSYQLVKGDDEKIARADIIFSNGLGLEHGPSLRALLEKNPKVFSLGDYLALKHPKEVIFVDKTPDPHIWMDVFLWSESIPLISEVLIKHVPQQESQIRAKSSLEMRKLQEIDAKIKQVFKSLPEYQKFLVTTHASCNYFTKAYLSSAQEREDGSWKKRCKAPEGLSPESQLSTADIQQLITYIEKHGVEVAFIESNVNYDSLKKVCEIMKKKGKPFRICTEPIYTDAMGGIGSNADSYSLMMLRNAKVISENLENHGK